jgi:hypothetical protein
MTIFAQLQSRSTMQRIADILVRAKTIPGHAAHAGPEQRREPDISANPRPV